MHTELQPEPSNDLDSNKQNQAPIEKKQRRKKPEILKFRTKIWYQSVRYLTGMKDGALDIEFGPKDEYGKDRHYVDRVRIFEELRKRSSSIIRGEKGKRGFDLVDEVAKKTGLEKTKELYEMPFWACVADRKPTIESITNHMASMIDALALFEKPLNTTDGEDAFLNAPFRNPDYFFSYVKAGPETYDFEIKESRLLLNSLGKKDDYIDLLTKFDIELLVRYFHNLTFNISYFRYSKFVGNLYASIAAAEATLDMLSLLFNGLEGLSNTVMIYMQIRDEILFPNRNTKSKYLKNLLKSNQDTNSPLWLLLMEKV
jgi:hypothetical protein